MRKAGSGLGASDGSWPRVADAIGLVGPMSNYAAPPQLVEDVPYRDLDEMHAFARRWRDEHRGQWFTVRKLSGFCLLMKRAVYDAVGGLDERFGLGFFDDDDLAERARRAGFELAVAHDLFVHHFGSRTFAGNGIDAEQLLEENERRFAEKWGQDVRRSAGGWRCGPWTEPAGFRIRGHQMPDSRSRIPDSDDPHACWRTSVSRTNNGQPTPGASQLDHDRPGRGKEPAALSRVGAGDLRRDRRRRYRQHRPDASRSPGRSGPGCSISSGSTTSPRRAMPRWRGPPAIMPSGSMPTTWSSRPSGRTLRALLDVACGRIRIAAYVVRCACDPGEDGSGGETVVDHIRLFPLREEIRWTYRVHEQILPALRRAKVPVRWTDLTVRHTGYTDRALRAQEARAR